MIREETLEELTDGRLYGLNDLVRVDTGDCRGCQNTCCEGMGSSVVLDPYDVHRLVDRLGKSFEELVRYELELGMADGLMLPNIRMKQSNDSCSFLDDNKRCTIHQFRPGVCRLFPLGRFWEDDTHYHYVLQKNQCMREGLTKIKVKKWIGEEYTKEYDEYIIRWHSFVKRVQRGLDSLSRTAVPSELPGQLRTVYMYILKNFYSNVWGDDRDFFEQIGPAIDDAIIKLGLEE